jgi:hypothetical protein
MKEEVGMVQLRTLIALGAVVGGLCWIAELLAERAGAPGGVLTLLMWAGLVLMTVAFLGAGVNLVRIGNHWLELVVGVATPTLVWSVVWAFKGGDADPYVVDGVFGALAAVYGVAVILRRSQGGDEDQPDLRPGRRRAE